MNGNESHQFTLKEW